MSQKLKKLEGQKTYRKGQITLDLRVLEKVEERDLNYHLLDQMISAIETHLQILEELDAEICGEMEAADLESVLTPSREHHLELCFILSRFKDIRERFAQQRTHAAPCNVSVSKAVKLPLPPIQLQSFQNNLANPFAYYIFKRSF